MHQGSASDNSPVTVDVLIVSHNTRALLEQCLDSIARHRPPPERIALGVRVFDNASSDGTVETIAARFPEVSLRACDHNEGFGAANNSLARDSRADYVLLLNPDTIWHSDIVSPLLAELERWPDAVIAGPRLIFPDGRPQPSSEGFPSLGFELAAALRGTKLASVPVLRRCEAVVARVRQSELLDDRRTRPAEFLWATCWLVRRDHVERNGLFDQRFPLYDEDLDFCFRLRAAGVRAIYVPGVELVHLGGASSTPTRKLRLMRTARERYYRLHHGIASALIYRFVVGSLWRISLRRRRPLPRGA